MKINKYYIKNKEKILKKNKQKYEANKEEILQQNKEYYLENKDYILDRNKKYKKRKKEEEYDNMSIEDQNRIKALAILKFFYTRINNREFTVESAGWWKESKGDGATLRIDVQGIGDLDQNDSE